MNKILVVFSESHETLYENFFYPSYEKFLSKDFDLIVKKVSQKCATGNFGDPGFDMTTLDRIKFVFDTIDIEDNNILFISDVDVQFFKNIDLDFIKEKDIDIWFQREHLSNYACAGMYMIKQNINTKRFFETVCETIDQSDGKDDQHAINSLKDSGIIKYDFLNRDLYWNVSVDTRCDVWIEGKYIKPPKDMVAHHANWTIGVNNKIALMNLVKNIVYQNY